MDGFRCAVVTAACVLIRQLDVAADVYRQLGLDLPGEVRRQLQEAQGEPKPDIFAAALEALQQASLPHFEGLPKLVDFSKISAGTLVAVVEKVRSLDLAAAGSVDLLQTGTMVERLLRQRAMTDRLAAESFSAAPLLTLMARLAHVKRGHRVHDPTCGAGGGLTAVARELTDGGGDPSRLYLSGQERNIETLSLCRLNLVLHGLLNFDLRQGDTLDSPGFREGSQIMKFDRVLNAPPWGLNRTTRKFESFGRFRYGEPPAGRADMAFLQHALAATEAGGRAVLHMPAGVLFRQGLEEDIRRNLVASGYLRAVVSLPLHILPYVSLPSVLLLFELLPQPLPEPEIVLVDASGFDFSWRDDDPARPLPHINRIVQVIETRQREAGFVELATLRDIEAHHFNLLPSLYTQLDTAAREDVEELSTDVQRLESELATIRERLDNGIAMLRGIASNQPARV